MEMEDTGSSDWQEKKGPKEQKVTLEEYQQLIIQMRRANLHFQQMCTVPSGELTMLLTLSKLFLRKAFVIPTDIGEAMKLSRPAVSRMLHNLERKGYLRMKSRKEDHRYVMVELTPKGRELIEKETEKFCRLLEKVAEKMGEKDMQEFLCYYSKFCSILADEVL